MKRLSIFAAVVLALGAVGATVFWFMAEDPEYQFKKAAALGRYSKYDDIITEVGQAYGVRPELIKAVIWRETRFQPDKVGLHGERGLMQITEDAATDWVRAEKITTFVPNDLFDPRTNIQVGTWYLKRALEHWSAKDDAVPFALAEYNAGRTRVKRWVKDSGQGENAGAGELQDAMDFPMTKSYIAAIVARYDFYKRNAEFSGQ
jgi:soluble lytic murein transglycosylase